MRSLGTVVVFAVLIGGAVLAFAEDEPAPAKAKPEAGAKPVLKDLA